MKIHGNIAPVTNSGDISQATLLAGPMPVGANGINVSTIKAIISGTPVAGTLQLYGVIGSATNPSQGPNGLTFPTTANDLIPMGAAVTFSAAAITAWDVGDTGMSALYVQWTKTGSSTGTLAVNWNAK